MGSPHSNEIDLHLRYQWCSPGVGWGGGGRLRACVFMSVQALCHLTFLYISATQLFGKRLAFAQNQSDFGMRKFTFPGWPLVKESKN